MLRVCDAASHTVNTDTQCCTHRPRCPRRPRRPRCPRGTVALKRKASLIAQRLCPDLMSWPVPLSLLFLAQRMCEGKGGVPVGVFVLLEPGPNKPSCVCLRSFFRLTGSREKSQQAVDSHRGRQKPNRLLNMTKNSKGDF